MTISSTELTIEQHDGVTEPHGGFTPTRDGQGREAEDSAQRRRARARARMQARVRSRAFTLIELLIVLEVGMILAAMALPSLQMSRKQADEASAVMALRQLSDAQELYRPRQSPPHYAGTMKQLRDAGLIDENIAATSIRSGYFFLIYGSPDANAYAFTATANVQGRTGDRSFYVDQTGVIRMADDASASPSSPALQ